MRESMLDLFELVVLVLINGVIDVGLVAWVAGRRSRQALETWLESPKSEEALKHLMTVAWNWFLSEQILTGKELVVLDEEGVEHKEKEKVTPLVALARTITAHLKMTLLGKVGGDRNKEKMLQEAIGADLQDPNNPLGSMMRSALPTALLRAQKTGDYASVAQLVLMPMVQEWLKKRTNQPPGAAAGAPMNTGDLRF
jgi:hypothetical protein